jgi:ribosomal protein S6--L-glutamate ligase
LILHRFYSKKYYKETAGTDTRIIVAGKKIIAAMERRSKGMDFRANLFGGGKALKVEPSEKIKKMAIDSIKALGLDYGGVDILKTKKRPAGARSERQPGTENRRDNKNKCRSGDCGGVGEGNID